MSYTTVHYTKCLHLFIYYSQLFLLLTGSNNRACFSCKHSVHRSLLLHYVTVNNWNRWVYNTYSFILGIKRAKGCYFCTKSECNLPASEDWACSRPSDHLFSGRPHPKPLCLPWKWSGESSFPLMSFLHILSLFFLDISASRHSQWEQKPLL